MPAENDDSIAGFSTSVAGPGREIHSAICPFTSTFLQYKSSLQDSLTVKIVVVAYIGP